MDSWIPLKVPAFAERIIGFSIPQDNKILVVSYDGIHLLQLNPEINVETDKSLSENDVYDSKLSIAKYHGKEYKIIGLDGGKPIFDGLEGERLVLDTDSETLSVEKDNKTVFTTDYKNFSGDWAAATFSTDKRFIILGCPYGFDFLVFERNVSG